ncbi:hypothetical protein OAS39_09440 [Pirellulales bacterium]|nr:hypothetical protein [Pirellulales bacterium]
MLSRPLVVRSFRDSASTLLSCAVLLLGFIWLRLWIASQINFDGILDLFGSGALPEFILKLLPVPLDALAKPLGRTAFGFEEMPVILLAGLWSIGRGSDCVAGRVGSGLMELLLAQPLSRLSVFASHAAVSLFGVVVLGLAAWCSTAIGVATSGFEERPGWLEYAPAAVNLTALSMFLLGVTSLAAAVAATRAQAVGWMIGFYFVEVACKIIALLSPSYAWLKKWTFLTAYEPTLLTVGLQSDPAKYKPMFLQHNGILIGLGALGLIFAAVLFCHRDVPAPD